MPLHTPNPNQFVSSTDWDGYIRILDSLSDRRVKITYDMGSLELSSPSELHEMTKTIIGALLECLFEELGVDAQGGGSTTFRRKTLDRGLEPDECYWIQSMPKALASHPDPETVPAPDLVVEVEVSRSALDRMAIYAALGVPEVWRWQADGSLRVHLLAQPGVYEESSTSPHYPALPLQAFEEWVGRGLSDGQIPTARRFRQWVRVTLK